MGDSVTPNEFRTAVAAAARNTAAAQAAIATQSVQIERLLSAVESIHELEHAKADRAQTDR